MNTATRILEALRSEPIRTVLWPILGAVVVALLTKGALSEFSADTVISIIGAVLAIPAAEVARAKVTPVSKLPDSERD